MAILPEKKLFGYKEVQELGDLKRLQLVLDNLDDEFLIKKLEKNRKYGRDDYPVRGMFNAVIAGKLYEHPTSASLIRELARNGQLREMCGLTKAPTSSAFSRFLSTLMNYQGDIEKLFNIQLNKLKKEFNKIGKKLGIKIAIDSKAVESAANRESKKEKPDRRTDSDASWSKKTYEGKREDGTKWKKVVSWFGYKVHLIVDAEYEIPLSFTVTDAAQPDIKEGKKLLSKLKKEHPDVLKNCKYWLADKAYDDTEIIKQLWDEENISPVIDIRQMWKKKPLVRMLEKNKNILYDNKGNVYCYPLDKKVKMAFGGFNKNRDTLKYRCPAYHYGYSCPRKESCSIGKSIRIPLSEDRRIFTPIARSSYKFDRIYKKRTSVERVFSRLGGTYNLDADHRIRGLKKMELEVSISFIVMVTMAIGRMKENQKEKMNSLVEAVI